LLTVWYTKTDRGVALPRVPTQLHPPAIID
jgi:hypothetical protein